MHVQLWDCIHISTCTRLAALLTVSACMVRRYIAGRHCGDAVCQPMQAILTTWQLKCRPSMQPRAQNDHWPQWPVVRPWTLTLLRARLRQGAAGFYWWAVMTAYSPERTRPEFLVSDHKAESCLQLAFSHFPPDYRIIKRTVVDYMQAITTICQLDQHVFWQISRQVWWNP
jgi:hypothetical protein